MKRPLLIVTISYILGIIIGVYLKNSISFIFAVNLMLTLILIINKLVRFIKIKNIYENIILLSLITLIVAEMSTASFINKYENINDNLNERTISAEAIVCGDIKETEYSYTVNAKITKIIIIIMLGIIKKIIIAKIIIMIKNIIISKLF